jgi:chitinase
MLIAALLTLAGAAVTAQGQSRPIVVGYYPSWSRTAYPHSVVDYQGVTHIAHAFIFPNSDGTLDLSGFSTYPELIQTAHANGVKVVISVGGWDEIRTPRFSQMVKDTSARSRFTATLRDFCLQHGYDGADIDWEYPSSSDRPHSMDLFRELRDSFSAVSPPLLLSIAAPSGDWSNRYDWALMTSVLDWIGVMTYDFYGSWTPKAGPNAPLYGSVSTTDQGWTDNSVNHYVNLKGVPAAKLLTGVPFYGWQFNASAMYGPSTGASQLPHNQIAPLLESGWVRYWDSTTRVPHLVNPAQDRVISYDDSASVSEKCAYVRSRGLGGVIIWALGQDFRNARQPLLEVVKLELTTVTGLPRQIAGAVPESVTLFQNYHNPFNAETTIRYALGKPAHVSLAVFDILGRRIIQLHEGWQEQGYYEVRVQSRELGSGVFYYRLRTGECAVSRSMMVLP